MEITWEIGNQITLYRDGDLWKCVSKSLYIKALKGRSQETLASFLQLEMRLCSNYAASLLSKRALTTGMLRGKLKEKGFEAGSIDHALNALEKYGYLNDEKRVEAAVEKYARSGYGPAYIQSKLIHTLKFSYEQAARAVDRYFSDHLLETALETAQRKMKQVSYPALQRRGFFHEQIAGVVRE